MLTYVKNKLLNNIWMAISLLVGNILLISIAVCSPMYSDAVLQRMLQRNLQSQMQTSGFYPGNVEFRGQYSIGTASPARFEKLAEMEQVAKDFAAAVPARVLYEITEYFKPEIRSTHQVSGGGNTFASRVDAISGFKDHVRMISGDLPSSEVKDLTMEAVVSQKKSFSKSCWMRTSSPIRSGLPVSLSPPTMMIPSGSTIPPRPPIISTWISMLLSSSGWRMKTTASSFLKR